jgi:hypothetical protein
MTAETIDGTKPLTKIHPTFGVFQIGGEGSSHCPGRFVEGTILSISLKRLGLGGGDLWQMRKNGLSFI